MTIEELAAELREMADDDGDLEINHHRADRLLIDFIAQLDGGEAVRDAYDAIGKWYA